jgi:hypothetical protein
MSWKLVYEKDKLEMTPQEHKTRAENGFVLVIIGIGLAMLYLSVFILPVAFFLWLVSYLLFAIFFVDANSRNILRRIEYKMDQKGGKQSERTRK